MNSNEAVLSMFADDADSDVSIPDASFMLIYADSCNTDLLTNKIPFLDVYGDINLVGHVIKSHKARNLIM